MKKNVFLCLILLFAYFINAYEITEDKMQLEKSYGISKTDDISLLKYYLAKENYQRAIDFGENLHKAKKGDSELFFLLGKAYKLGKHYDKASFYFEKSIALNYRLTESELNLADCYENLNKKELALVLYKKLHNTGTESDDLDKFIASKIKNKKERKNFYSCQLSLSSSLKNTEIFIKKMRTKLDNKYEIFYIKEKGKYKILAGKFNNKKDAQKLSSLLKKKKISHFITNLDLEE